MSHQTDRLRRAAKKIAAKAVSVATDAKHEVQRQVRHRRVKEIVKHAGEAATIAGAAALGAAAVDEANRFLRKRGLSRLGRPLGFEVNLNLAPPAAIERVTELLKSEGFGILTRIDVHTTFDEKLGIRFRPYTILGVCNPGLAHRALSARAETGLMLPCNVTVEERPGGGSTVRIADPATMLLAADLRRDPELRVIARKAREHLSRAAETLAAHGEAVVL
jgi:uncharacterized protein (DUF302 family)